MKINGFRMHLFLGLHYYILIFKLNYNKKL